MSAYCPKCETDLDPSTGICPACRWDPRISTDVRTVRTAEPEMSLTERYRGTQYDVSLQSAMVSSHQGVSRGRTFVIIGLVAAASLYGVVMGAMGVF
jgi:hypothetical protein